MADVIPNSDIGALLLERKPLPLDWRRRMTLKPKRGHREAQLELAGDGGSTFRVILRESLFNPLAFSAILAYVRPRTNTVFRLRRYNGKSHEHTNKIEHVTFFDFHIHFATERYQLAGADEDAYAEPTTRFADVNGALDCLISDCGIVLPSNTSAQGRLFS